MSGLTKQTPGAGVVCRQVCAQHQRQRREGCEQEPTLHYIVGPRAAQLLLQTLSQKPEPKPT